MMATMTMMTMTIIMMTMMATMTMMIISWCSDDNQVDDTRANREECVRKEIRLPKTNTASSFYCLINGNDYLMMMRMMKV